MCVHARAHAHISCTCAYAHMHVCTHMHTCTHMHICTYAHAHTCTLGFNVTDPSSGALVARRYGIWQVSTACACTRAHAHMCTCEHMRIFQQRLVLLDGEKMRCRLCISVHHSCVAPFLNPGAFWTYTFEAPYSSPSLPPLVFSFPSSVPPSWV